jgi:hypothetical protein
MRPSEAKWRVNHRPRFTVLEMAAYMVADDGPRDTILRNMRYEQLRGTTFYRHLYRAIPRFLTSPTRDRSILDQCRRELEHKRDRAASPRATDNATYALRALDVFEGSLNALPLAGWTLEYAPAAPPLKFDGVSVSVQPTAHIRVRRPKYFDYAGALLIDPAKGTVAKSEKAKTDATNEMRIAAMLLHQYVVRMFPGDDPRASTNHCVVFHTHRRQAEVCPTNYRRKLRNIEAACGHIARGWAGIPKPPDFDEALAVHRY